MSLSLMRILFAAVAAAIASATICVPAANAIPGFQSCEPRSGYRIDVKNVSCDDAWLVDAYNWEDGGKFQSFGDYDCYTLAWAARPQVLTCVSPAGELVVSE